MPIYLFALMVSPQRPLLQVLLSFIIIHVFLYPASNGYNSYFDKDENSIGGLERPPKVSAQLYWTALVFDAIAIGLGLLINLPFAMMLFIYGIISKAYSHPSVRLKKMPIIGWLSAGLFQGFFTFVMVLVALNGFDWRYFWQIEYLLPAILSSMFLWGSYPMTQVYQHEEDARRGDQTLSLKLGILGTFHFTSLLFLVANLGFVYYFITYFSISVVLFFVYMLLPVLIYFSIWYWKVRKNRQMADFKHTMWLNFISSTSLSLFFIISIWLIV
jgi:1,4-dihydroxy-2-naphthoate octaprenyltransferase